MFTDARISAAMQTMVNEIDAPPVPLFDIQRKISQPQTVVRFVPRYLQLAMATAAIMALVVFVFRSSSLGVVQTIEARYRAAVQAMGGIAPAERPPQALMPALSPQIATRATAQSRVPFTLVTPAGLPRDTVAAKIQTTPVAVYSKATHTWRIASQVVTFSYERAGGRSFDLMAERFDPRGEAPGRYLFEAKDPTADGRPVIVKHERFTWRNGDQTMTAVEWGITASEIAAIQAAMHGVSLPRRELHAPGSGTTTFIRLRTP